MAPPNLSILFIIFFFLASFSSSTSTSNASPKVNPFTAKAAFIRYWNRKVPNNLPHPPFFTSKLSPLSALETTTFASLLSSRTTNTTTPLDHSKLTNFCKSASILCVSDSVTTKSATSGAFTKYQNTNFSNYGTTGTSGADTFATYSPDLNLPVDTFRRYSRDAVHRNDTFTNYQADGNVVTANFTSYAGGATAGAGTFASYGEEVNVPDFTFTNYDAAANGRDRTFESYSSEANSGDESFSGYGKNANGDVESFASYADNSNVVGSGFNNYGENGNGATDSFSAYGQNGNVPENSFKNYGAGGNAGSDRFSSYRVDANVGDDTFASYAKDANAGDAEFENYGKSFNQGSDTFKGYGEGSNTNHRVGFKAYFGDNTTFKSYAMSGIEFKELHNSTTSSALQQQQQQSLISSTNHTKNKWAPEPGKFFRESELKQGNVMPMPDIHDKMPARAFLPRAIADKIPFKADSVNGLFGLPKDTALGKAIVATVAECERAPSHGESKKCAVSPEDVIDFAVEMLGNDIVVRSTVSTNGSSGDIVIGKVNGVNGGNVTRAVSCHMSLFPYLVYYCHSVPEVRVYEADILAVDSKEKINHGVAICHLDTSNWSANHGAFVALGGKPGEIEVCHWIFEGDMTWTVAD